MNGYKKYRRTLPLEPYHAIVE